MGGPGELTSEEFANVLWEWAGTVTLALYRKSSRGPKKPRRHVRTIRRSRTFQPLGSSLSDAEKLGAFKVLISPT
jgi:hypothetical protein